MVRSQVVNQRTHLSLLFHPEATITTAAIGRAQGTAASLGNRAQTVLALGDEYADIAPRLALHTNAFAGDLGLAGNPLYRSRKISCDKIVAGVS